MKTILQALHSLFWFAVIMFITVLFIVGTISLLT
jgi:hypothetical protein